MSSYKKEIQQFLAEVAARNPNEPEFLQAVEEFAEAVVPFAIQHPRYAQASLLHRITEPTCDYLSRAMAGRQGAGTC